MAKDHDFKRLVRVRMQDTGERYTQARTALAAQRDAGGLLVSDRSAACWVSSRTSGSRW